MGGLGMVGVIGISAPMSLAVIDETTSTSIKEKISNIANRAYTEVSDQANDLPGKFKTTYEKAWNEAGEHLTSAQSNLYGKYGEGIDQAKSYYTTAEGLADTVNYQLFEFGPFIRQFLSYFPIFIEESIFESFKGEEDSEEFLSFQKLVSIATGEGLMDTLTKVAEVAANHGDKLNEMSYSDGHGLMSIIRELKNNESDIKEWLEKIKNNAEAINADKSEQYCSSTKLLMHLLIGKNTVNGIGNKVKEVEKIMNTLKKLKDLLPNLKTEDFNKFEDKINALKTQTESNTKWVDPCPSKVTSSPESVDVQA